MRSPESGPRPGAPRKPSGFAQYRALLAKDLVRELRTKEMLVSMGVYALLVIVVLGIASGFAEAADAFLGISGGLVWSVVVFTSLLGLNRSFSVEREGGCIEGVLLAPLDRGVVFLSKATSNLVFLLVVECVAIPLFWFFFAGSARPAATAPLMVAPLLLGSIGIAGVGTLLATITSGTRGRDVMLALLLVPVTFPLLYACVAATTACVVGADAAGIPFTAALVLAGGYDVIMILLAWVLYEFALA